MVEMIPEHVGWLCAHGGTDPPSWLWQLLSWALRKVLSCADLVFSGGCGLAARLFTGDCLVSETAAGSTIACCCPLILPLREGDAVPPHLGRRVALAVVSGDLELTSTCFEAKVAPPPRARMLPDDDVTGRRPGDLFVPGLLPFLIWVSRSSWRGGLQRRRGCGSCE